MADNQAKPATTPEATSGAEVLRANGSRLDTMMQQHRDMMNAEGEFAPAELRLRGLAILKAKGIKEAVSDLAVLCQVLPEDSMIRAQYQQICGVILGTIAQQTQDIKNEAEKARIAAEAGTTEASEAK